MQTLLEYDQAISKVLGEGTAERKRQAMFIHEKQHKWRRAHIFCDISPMSHNVTPYHTFKISEP